MTRRSSIPRLPRSAPASGTCPFAAALLLLLVCACGPNAPETDPAPIVVGTNQDFSGNSFSRNVSRQFGEDELKRLHAQLNDAPFKSRLEGYACALPPFTVSVGLWPEGPYQERLVRMQMTPPVYRNSGCTEDGAGYLFERAVKDLDHGPPIDYGYRHSLDGSPVGARAPDEPDEPECRCETGAPRTRRRAAPRRTSTTCVGITAFRSGSTRGASRTRRMGGRLHSVP